MHNAALAQHHINKPYLFMRWKEQFVFPSTTARIHGASFAGFYYLCELQRLA